MKQLVQDHTAGQRQRQERRSGLSYFAVLARTTLPLTCACLYTSPSTDTCTPAYACVFITPRSHTTSVHPNMATSVLCGHSPRHCRHTDAWVYLHTHTVTHMCVRAWITCCSYSMRTQGASHAAAPGSGISISKEGEVSPAPLPSQVVNYC